MTTQEFYDFVNKNITGFMLSIKAERNMAGGYFVSYKLKEDNGEFLISIGFSGQEATDGFVQVFYKQSNGGKKVLYSKSFLTENLPLAWENLKKFLLGGK